MKLKVMNSVEKVGEIYSSSHRSLLQSSLPEQPRSIGSSSTTKFSPDLVQPSSIALILKYNPAFIHRVAGSPVDETELFKSCNIQAS